MCARRKENAGKRIRSRAPWGRLPRRQKPLAIFIVRIMLQDGRGQGEGPVPRQRANVSAYKNSHFNICQLAARSVTSAGSVGSWFAVPTRTLLPRVNSAQVWSLALSLSLWRGLFACHFICAQQLALFAVPATSRVDFCVWATFQLQLIYFICKQAAHSSSTLCRYHSQNMIQNKHYKMYCIAQGASPAAYCTWCTKYSYCDLGVILHHHHGHAVNEFCYLQTNCITRNCLAPYSWRDNLPAAPCAH